MGQKKTCVMNLKEINWGMEKWSQPNFWHTADIIWKIARKIALYNSKNFHLTFFFLKKNQRFKQTVVLMSRL